MKAILVLCVSVLLVAAFLQLTGCDDPTGPSGGSGVGGGNVTPKLPDLVFSSVCIGNDGNQKCGAITWKMPAARISASNSGNAQANPPVEVKFGIWDGYSSTWYILWSTPDITKNTIWYQGRYCYSPEFKYVYPCNAPAGYYRFRLEIDPGNRVRESDESNNVWVSSFTFYVSH